jgi:AcrR family transcriptional regulator
MIEDGPEGVRVQHIAADLGMTGAALHYHFGSREALIDSVGRFVAKRLLNDIDAILETWDVDRLDIRRLGALFRKTYADRGAARLIFWRALSGHKPRGSGLLGGLIEAAHQSRERRARASGRTPPPISDTRFVIALLSSVHAVMPIAGDALLLSTAAEAGKVGNERFLDWVASLLEAHLNAAGP